MESHDEPLLQEMLLKEDDWPLWKMLCGCILLNCTSRAQVDRVWPTLFEEFPDPQSIAYANSKRIERLETLLSPLGFKMRRLRALIYMSRDFLALDDTDLDDAVMNMNLYGIGEYARDSYIMFVRGEFPEDRPELDKELRKIAEQRNWGREPVAA